jgi:hypothetical protein
MKNISAAILFLLMILAVTAQAQTTAEITGRITDVSSAVVPGTAVKVTNVDKKIDRTTASNEQGYYTVGNLDPGNYEVSVRVAGFKAVTRKGISLDVNQSVRLDFALEVGAVSEQIEVTARAPLLESATAQLGTLMSEEKIADLPLNARNFTQLLSLTPGASPVSVAQNAGGGQTTAPIGVLVFPAINGQTNRSNSFMLDGVYNNGHFTGTYDIAPNVDGLNEFKVQSHSDLAEFGGATGGVINIATKGGGNAFHGSLYEFLRNDKLDARGFFTALKPPLRQNQFGGTVGGPVFKNKTFFFFSYEGFRQVAGSNQLSLIPTPAQIGGNFSGSPQLYDAYSTVADPTNSNRLLRDPFPGNQIPPSRLSPSIEAFAAAIIPKPVSTGFTGFNALNTDSQTFPGENYGIRLDHYLSSRDWLWFRYNWGNGDQKQALALPGTVDAKKIPAENIGASYTHNFTSNTVMSVLLGFTSTTFFDAPTFTSQDLISKGFFKGFPVDPRTLVPGVTIPGYFSLSMRNRTLGPQQGWQYHTDFSHNHGRHNLKFGAELVTQPWTNTQITDALIFSSRPTADLNNLGGTGNTLASFMMGLMDQTQLNIADFSLTSHLWAFYAQDSWKVTDKLTVNFGLRWDAAPAPTFWRDFPSTWDFSSGKFIVGAPKPPACSAINKTPCLPDPNNAYVNQWVVFTGSTKLRSDELRLPGPRLGMAYRLGAHTVLRGSFGIFYDLMAGVNQQAQNGNINNANWPGFKGATPNSNATLVTATADAPFGTTNIFLPATTPAAVTANFFDPHFRSPYSEQWNLEVQREFTHGISLSVGYVGSHSLRLSVSGDYNTALTPGPGAIAPRALWPNAPVTIYDRSVGQSKYNSLQVKVEKRLAGGLSFLMAYSWSKSIDVASSGQFEESVSNQNTYDPNSSRGVSGFDVPQVFSLATIYALPFGHGKLWLSQGIASRIFGNWQLNGIVQARSGQPFTPVTNLDIANIGALDASSRDRPDLIGDPKLSNPTPSLWFNKAVFKSPAQYTFGSAGRNILRGDSLKDVDLSLFREDRLSERIKLQFRAESFNLFNHPTFDLPQATITSPLFGVVGGTIGNARQIQLGLKLLF